MHLQTALIAATAPWTAAVRRRPAFVTFEQEPETDAATIEYV
jgi:hypothetical protein